jgi:hypothetical protein
VIFLLAALAVDYVSVDLRTREVVEQQIENRAVPVGSLVKPFLAMAWSGDFPEFTCTGSKCWLARGHGRLKFRNALAVSCNEYFLNLARGVDTESLRLVAAKFGIPAPEGDSPEARIGLGTAWRIEPVILARAYAELVARSGEPKVGEILDGLKMSAESGTASAIGRGFWAKTGTAACVAEKRDDGDGFTVVITPSRVVLVRVHGVPGAEAAKSAKQILRRLK